MEQHGEKLVSLTQTRSAIVEQALEEHVRKGKVVEGVIDERVPTYHQIIGIRISVDAVSREYKRRGKHRVIFSVDARADFDPARLDEGSPYAEEITMHNEAIITIYNNETVTIEQIKHERQACKRLSRERRRRQCEFAKLVRSLQQ
jgi:prophage tail gpP-like protein